MFGGEYLKCGRSAVVMGVTTGRRRRAHVHAGWKSEIIYA
jgi:hypothetical protein